MDCHRLFTVNDILELCPISSLVHALKVLELIQELFLDIPNFDEFLDILRFEECSASDDLSHLLRDVTLLSDSPESTDGENEEVVGEVEVRLSPKGKHRFPSVHRS